ncbi:ATP-binding protein [Streptomyces decoyicus]|uniref:ATP-binding protein n=1 Tax=Streptomyces decoyicus TaxID=249567 RepID=A0ABZ1F8M6_9ACTN|nr:ATP-binding protein [Streptomyces decoyicus]WSB66590.1 ATP-binding protein [Streptomyces decoyicus]
MAVMAEASTQQYRQELTVQPQNLEHIRRIVGAYLRYWGRDEFVERAAVCVTELLSNVHKHTGSAACVLLLQISPSGVRIVVSDESQDLPVVREPNWFAESGRGMFLISKTVDAWGAEPTPDGKDVWFEIRASNKGAA